MHANRLISRIPNLPFFYLVYRAWSHWRAFSGSKHIQFLLENKLIQPTPSKTLSELYASTNTKSVQDNAAENEGSETSESKDEEAMVLTKASAKIIADTLEVPELEVELDRAIWQVETALRGHEELRQEKVDLEKSATDIQAQSQEKEKR